MKPHKRWYNDRVEQCPFTAEGIKDGNGKTIAFFCRGCRARWNSRWTKLSDPPKVERAGEVWQLQDPEQYDLGQRALGNRVPARAVRATSDDP